MDIKIKKNTNVKDNDYGLDRKIPTLPPTTEDSITVEQTKAPTECIFDEIS
jgi:hypothetical protein